MTGQARWLLPLIVGSTFIACVDNDTTTIPDPTDAGTDASTPVVIDDAGSPPDEDAGSVQDAAPDVETPPPDSGTPCGGGSKQCLDTMDNQNTTTCEATESFCKSNCELGSEPAACVQTCQTKFATCQQKLEDTCTTCEASAHDCNARADCHAHAQTP